MKKQDIIKLAQDITLQGVTRTQIDFLQECIADGEVWEGDFLRRTNDFPQYLCRLVEDSPVARACYRVLQNYVRGSGLTQPEVLKTPVGNDSEPFEIVLENVANDYVLLFRYAILVRFDFNGLNGYKVKSFSHLPAEYCRYSIPTIEGEVNSVVYNPYFNTSEAQLRTQYMIYPLFNLETVEEDMKCFAQMNKHRNDCEKLEFAQVIFFNQTTPLNRTYSRPDISSAENAMIADALIWKFHVANLRNNGFLGGILNVYGDPDKPAYEVIEGRGTVSVGEEFERKIRNMFSGAGNAGAIMTNWLLNPTDMPTKFDSFQSNDNDTKFSELPALLKEAIATAFNVPSILANIQQSGKLGNTQEVELAIKQMNANIAGKQRVLEAQFTYLLRAVLGTFEVECNIIPTSPVLEVPQFIFDSLTPEQKSEYIEKNYGIKQSEIPPTSLLSNGTTENTPN